MYQTLRSSGGLSYNAVEKAFEDHQGKWSEAIFNEDAWFKYIDPLINDGNGAYLEMMQGSKKEQRKWWLYNRFRYIDSKYNAGDALSDVIQLRGYAKANITVIPYADIYPTVKYGSYLVHERGKRGVATTLLNPLDNVNDTEIYIYSSSQLASVGDLSGLLVGFADFSMATKLQSLKIGSDATGYSNTNLKTLTLGNNVLLKTIDVRNCVGLGTGDQKAVDISGCTNIEDVYFDGTQVTSVALPNGGIIKKLHLPATVTNLTIMNQKSITEFVMPSYANITTLRLENVSTAIDMFDILDAIQANSRIRLIGFYIEAQNAQEISELFDIFDTMRGLDEQGNNMDAAQVSGEVHTSSLTGNEIAEFNARYPYVRVTADHTSAILTYKTYDGASVLFTETVLDGGNGTKVNSTARISDAQYSYTADGWATEINGNKDVNALVNVVADRTVFAAYTKTLRKYTVTFVRASDDGGGTLQTMSNVAYGTAVTASSSYTGATPTTTQGSAEDYPFEGWNPASATVQGDTVFTAKFGSPVEDVEISDDWDTIIANVNDGTYATKYKIGNYKPLDLGTEGTINMQIVAMDADELADGNGYAPMTFVAKELLETQHRMNINASTNYYYPEIPSWKRTNGYDFWKFESTNKYYTPSTAKMTLTLIAKEDVETRIEYRLVTDVSRGSLRIDVNGETIVSGYSSGTVATYSLSVLANSVTTIYAEFQLLHSSYSTSGVIEVYNKDKFTLTEDIQNAPSRQVKGYSGGAVGGWEKSEMRSYLSNTILPVIPSNVQSHITPVVKYSSSINGGVNDTYFKDNPSIDRLWIPSNRELKNTSQYETKGEAYNKIYGKTSASLSKFTPSTPTTYRLYWTRTVLTYEAYLTIIKNGKTSSSNAHYSNYICLGFCLGNEVETISDSWDTILANQYARASYKIGDTKWMKLSSGEKVLMQIVGFSCDELADGNGVARISWISKYLLNDPHVINSEETTSGGWQASGMRSYLNGTIKPMLPENIRNGIQTVKKYSSTYENGKLVKDGQITSDDLWIPGHKEIFNNTIYETKSPSYSTIFTDATSRKKTRVSNATAYSNYWTRSTNSSSKFMCTDYNGSSQNQYARVRMCIALGFCTGATATPEDVIYLFRETTSFNGSTTYFDTGLQLMNGRNSFTIVFDCLDVMQPANQSNQYTLLHCMHEVSPWLGFALQGKRTSNNIEYSIDFNFSSSSQWITVAGGAYNSNRRVKMAIIVDYTSNKMTVYSDVNGTTKTDEINIPSDTTSLSETTLIGCYQTTTGGRGRYWQGLMYDLKIYNRALTSTEAQAYLAEDHS